MAKKVTPKPVVGRDIGIMDDPVAAMDFRGREERRRVVDTARLLLVAGQAPKDALATAFEFETMGFDFVADPLASKKWAKP